MTCPGSACSSPVHPDDILKLLEGDDLYQLINAVGSSIATLLLFCCSCGYCSRKGLTSVHLVQQVCSKCYLPAHEGISCARAKVSSTVGTWES